MLVSYSTQFSSALTEHYIILSISSTHCQQFNFAPLEQRVKRSEVVWMWLINENNTRWFRISKLFQVDRKYSHHLGSRFRAKRKQLRSRESLTGQRTEVSPLLWNRSTRKLDTGWMKQTNMQLCQHDVTKYSSCFKYCCRIYSFFTIQNSINYLWDSLAQERFFVWRGGTLHS